MSENFASANKPTSNHLENLVSSGAMNSSLGTAPKAEMISSQERGESIGPSFASSQVPFSDHQLPVGEVIGGNVDSAFRVQSVDELLHTSDITNLDLNQFAPLAPAVLESGGRSLNINEVNSGGLGISDVVKKGFTQGAWDHSQQGG